MLEDLSLLFSSLTRLTVGALTSLLLLLLLVVAIYIAVRYIKDLKLPPGPPGLPVIGNVHQIPKTGAHHHFTAWARQYGGIFSIKIGPATAVVLTDRRLVKTLIDKKSSLYSERPTSFVTNLITRGDHLLVMKHSGRWRQVRKLVHQHFMEAMCDKQHVVLQDAEAVQMIKDFLIQPAMGANHMKRFSNSIVMSILYGIRTPVSSTWHMTELYDMMERWSKITETGATPPVDIFPFLKLAPESWFGNWISRARDVGKRMDALYGTMRKRVVARRMAQGSGGSFFDNVLDVQEKLGFNDHLINFIGGVLMEGGSDTTSSMLTVFLQAMANNPEVQRKAHTEIDLTIGEDRTPRWSDFKDLPYINQIIKECMRWRPVAPLAFPHALAQDDIVDGYHIPAGTTIIINVWGLHHDPSYFVDPEKFDPDRYAGKTALAPEYAAGPDYANRDHYVYGAGRRICPGMHLAERNMFLAIAKMLWAFDIKPKVDPKTGLRAAIGTDPILDYTEGFLVCPKDFVCDVQVRSERRRETILSEYAMAESRVFAKYE